MKLVYVYHAKEPIFFLTSHYLINETRRVIGLKGFNTNKVDYFYVFEDDRKLIVASTPIYENVFDPNSHFIISSITSEFYIDFNNDLIEDRFVIKASREYLGIIWNKERTAIGIFKS